MSGFKEPFKVKQSAEPPCGFSHSPLVPQRPSLIVMALDPRVHLNEGERAGVCLPQSTSLGPRPRGMGTSSLDTRGKPGIPPQC